MYVAERAKFAHDPAANRAFTILDFVRWQRTVQPPVNQVPGIVESAGDWQSDRAPWPAIDLHKHKSSLGALVLHHRDTRESDGTHESSAGQNDLFVGSDRL